MSEEAKVKILIDAKAFNCSVDRAMKKLNRMRRLAREVKKEISGIDRFYMLEQWIHGDKK